MGRRKTKRFYFSVCLAELLVLVFFAAAVSQKEAYVYHYQSYFTGENDTSGKLYTEGVFVPEGIYEVTVAYEREKGNAVCYAQASEAGVHSLYSDRIKLSSVQNAGTFTVYVNDDVQDLRLVVEPEVPGEFSVNGIQIMTAGNSAAYQIFCMALKLLIINLIIAVIYFRKGNFKRSTEVLGIAVIGTIASLGLLEEYILYGHDLVFHLYRIEGIKDGLLAGGYPVKLQPNWFHGWGYPVSVMYGDQLLYFPALLRLLGVSVQNAYKAYIAGINFATAAAAYYSFHKISKDKRTALFGSCLYTLAPYRLSCIYVRAALGEYSAMLFLPLAALCFWYAFENEEDRKISADKLSAPVIGFSGLIQTHVLTCFMAAIAIVIFCLFHVKKVFRKETLAYFIRIAGITLLFNLWFLIPFFQYMGEDLVVTAKVQMTPSFQRWGATFAELFSVYWNGTLHSNWGEIATIAQKFPKPVGTAFLLVAVLALWMYHKEKLRLHEKKVFWCIIFFVLFTFMASTAFPYYAINKAVPALGSLLAKIQFSYRFLTLVILFGSMLAVILITEIAGVYGRGTAGAVMALVGILAVIQGAQFVYGAMYRGDVYLIYDLAAIDGNVASGGEYLYEGSWESVTESDREPAGEGAVIENFSKRYNTITLTCKAKRPDAYLLMPLYYYIGYEARDLDTGEQFEILRSEDNNRIRVNLPEGYEGTLKVSFREPVSWRIAEVISLLGIILGGVFQLLIWRRAKTVAQPI